MHWLSRRLFTRPVTAAALKPSVPDRLEVLALEDRVATGTMLDALLFGALAEPDRPSRTAQTPTTFRPWARDTAGQDTLLVEWPQPAHGLAVDAGGPAGVVAAAPNVPRLSDFEDLLQLSPGGSVPPPTTDAASALVGVEFSDGGAMPLNAMGGIAPSVDPVTAEMVRPADAATLSDQTLAMSPTADGKPRPVFSMAGVDGLPREGGFAGLGLLTRRDFQKGATTVQDTSGFAPESRLDLFASKHGRRDLVSGIISGEGVASPGATHLNRPTTTNATGIAGSVSPEVLLGRSGLSDLFSLRGRVAQSQQAVALSPSETGSPADGDAAAGEVAPGLAFLQDGGGGGDEPQVTKVEVRNDRLTAAFTFTLDVRGTDSTGHYVLREVGTGTLADIDPNAEVVPGTVEVRRQFHRGTAPITDADTVTVDTVTFDASEPGLVHGFDLDGYNETQYGVTVDTASQYDLVVGGEDVFTDDYQGDITTEDEDRGSTVVDDLAFLNKGTQKYDMKVSGPGTARQYTIAQEGGSKFTFGQDAVGTVALVGTSGSETYFSSSSGSSTTTSSAEGVLDALGVATPTKFYVQTNTTETGTSKTVGGGDWDGEDGKGSTTYSENHATEGTDSITITGTGTDWSAVVSIAGSDDLTATDAGNHGMSTEQGSGSDELSVTTNGNWSNTVGGKYTQSLSAEVTGSGESATVEDVDLTLSGWSSFDTSDHASSTSAGGGDTFNAATTETANGKSDVTLRVTSEDGEEFAVTLDETIAAGYTDSETGDYEYSDPYSFDSLSGTEVGSGEYSDSDNGSETVTIGAGGTLGADGEFDLTGFTADIVGSAGTVGSDSDTATVTVPDQEASDGDAGSSSATNGYEVRLRNTGGDTTAVTEKQTVTGHFGNTETDDAAWGGLADDESADADGGTETDVNADSSNSTVVSEQSGTLAADGKYALASGKVTAKGTTTFTDNEGLFVRDDEPDGDDTSNQNRGASGSDKYDLNVTRAADGAVTLASTEDIAQTMGLNGQVDADDGIVSRDGTINLAGPVSAKIVHTGDNKGGAFELDPANGNSKVGLGGSYRVDYVAEGDWSAITSNPEVAKYAVLEYEGFPAAEALFPSKMKITREIKNGGLTIKQSDTEVNGVWTAGDIEYADSPSVKITTVADYAWASPNPNVMSLRRVDGTGTYVIEESMAADHKGTGAALTGGLDRSRRETQNVNLSWSGVGAHDFPFDGEMTRSKDFSEVYTVDGGRTGGVTTATGKTVMHKEVHYDSHENYKLGAPWEWFAARDHRKYDTVDDEVVVAQLDPANPTVGVATEVSGSGWIKQSNDRTYSGPGGGGTINATGDTKWDYVPAAGGVPARVERLNTAHITIAGTHYISGADVSYDGPQSTMPVAPAEPKDWFDAVATFSAGMGDAVSGGLTKHVRRALGYDDAVKAGSRAHSFGDGVGTVVGVATSFANPCGYVGAVRYGIKAVNAAQAAGNVLDAGNAFREGNYGTGLLHLAGATASVSQLLKACFVAGTPVRTPTGGVPIEELKPGDWVLSRDERDPTGPVRPRRVLQAFVRTSLVMDVFAGGRRVGTTGEHPFYVDGTGWVDAGALRHGNGLVSSAGAVVPVDGTDDAGRVAVVYNVEVEGDHTYFIGGQEWGFDLWCHNSDAYIDGVRRVAHGHKNSNRSISNYGIYEIKKDGVLVKIGKADMESVVAESGLPTRLHAQLRKMISADPTQKITGEIVLKLGKTTTAAARQVEIWMLQTLYDCKRIIPELNRPSFKPK